VWQLFPPTVNECTRDMTTAITTGLMASDHHLTGTGGNVVGNQQVGRLAACLTRLTNVTHKETYRELVGMALHPIGRRRMSEFLASIRVKLA
jgi:hypothetical protein